MPAGTNSGIALGRVVFWNRSGKNGILESLWEEWYSGIALGRMVFWNRSGKNGILDAWPEVPREKDERTSTALRFVLLLSWGHNGLALMPQQSW